MKNLPDDLPATDGSDPSSTPGLPDDSDQRHRQPSRISASTLEAARAVDRHYAERRAERSGPGGSHDD